MPAPTDIQQSRRDSGPTTRRGEARKNELLDAARTVFERHGFANANVALIVAEAKVSRGTFYTYFDTKEAVFEAVSRDVVEKMLAAMSIPIPTADLRMRVRGMVERFVAAYRPNAGMLALMEGLGAFSPELRYLRLEAREAFVRRTCRGIERMQQANIADPDLDVEYIAQTLGAMLDQTCHIWFTLKMEFDTERLVDALSTVWIKTLLPAGAAMHPEAG